MPFGSNRARRPRRGIPVRLIFALVVAGVSLFVYFGRTSTNPLTGKTQRVAMTIDQEIALGLQAAPEMAQQFGGLLQDQGAQDLVDSIGAKLLSALPAEARPYPFDFHVLADPSTVNAFALPGGQVFITDALMDRLTTEGQLAGVLGHEIGHVVGRHSAEQLAKAELTQGLTGAAVIATYDPQNPASRSAPAIAMMVGQLVNMSFSREHELEADQLGVRMLADAGYDPRALIAVMRVLAEASEGGAPPEFFSTHPNPDNRIGKIEEAIAAEFPQGVPSGLTP